MTDTTIIQLDDVLVCHPGVTYKKYVMEVWTSALPGQLNSHQYAVQLVKNELLHQGVEQAFFRSVGFIEQGTRRLWGVLFEADETDEAIASLVSSWRIVPC